MKIESNIPLDSYTTFRIGGPADFFCIVSTLRDLGDALIFARDRKIPFFILGGGSNILITDLGFRGLVIKNEIKGFETKEIGDKVLVTFGAGEDWDMCVKKTVELGLWGLENLSWIPGTLGASPVQNIGAYGVEVKNAIDSVETYDSLIGQLKTFTREECGFGYRTSVFKKPEYKRFVITRVTFSLSRTPHRMLDYKDVKEFFGAQNNLVPSQKEIRDAIISIRSHKFPDLSTIGTAGSFWKNPVITQNLYDTLHATYKDMPSFPATTGVKVPLAWILDHVCHLKGYARDKVRLFEKQPLVLVAGFGSRATDVVELANTVEQTVKEKTGIHIEREVEWVN